jgi:hypothetical protein
MPMITINLAPLHPVTVVANDQRRYHFARFIAMSGRFMVVELRKTPEDTGLLVTHVIVDLFGLLGVVRVGTVSIQIDCVNVSLTGKRFLRLQPTDALALKIRITPSLKS